MSDLQQLYTIDEIAAAMKLRKDTVLRHMARYEIPRIGNGRGMRLTREAYDLLIQRLCSSSSHLASDPAHGSCVDVTPADSSRSALARLTRSWRDSGTGRFSGRLAQGSKSRPIRSGSRRQAEPT